MSEGNANLKPEETPVLQVLVIEDSADDFELFTRTLEKAGLRINPARVSSREGFQNLVASYRYDVILSGCNLAGWTGMEALALLKEQKNDTPFIIVTGALGEERAVQCIKEGAADFILKARVAALPDAVRGAISERAARDARKRAETALRESEAMFRLLADSIASAVLVYQGTKCRYANRAAQTLTGYSERELLDLNSWELVHPHSRSLVIEHGLSRVRDARDSDRYEAQILTKQGNVRVWDVTMGKIEIQGHAAGLMTALDVTDRKMADSASEQVALRDPLTGLLSNAQAQNVFLGETKRSRRTGRCFALVLLKLDELKEIREQSGFVGGSRALCRLARVVGEVCRAADAAARFSEDEFVLILPETTVAGARRFVQRIAEQLRAESDGAQLAVSAGTAVFPQDGPTIEHAAGSARRLLKAIRAKRVIDEFAPSA